MISLLEATKPYIHRFKGIRISTRPDAVTYDILQLLKQYKVTSIELGAQSMDDAVLLANNRGHNSDCVRVASKLIKAEGFSLGLQMMTGLYTSSDKSDIYTANEFIAIKPDTVRIYPTVILQNTKLGELFLKGIYKPQTLDSAVNLCAQLITKFEESNIKVIRVGLHSSDTMESEILAGAYHPAFKELCENKIFLNKITDILSTKDLKTNSIRIFVAPDAVSKATGQRKSNLTKLKEMRYEATVATDPTLKDRQIIIQEG